MLLFRAPVTAEEQMNVSPDEMKKGMDLWNTWYAKVGAAIVDMGAPLANGIHVTKTSTSKARVQVTGYTIVQAEDSDAVKALLTDHPHFVVSNASIDIFELMPIMM